MTSRAGYRFGWRDSLAILVTVGVPVALLAFLVGAIWLATSHLGLQAALAWAAFLVLCIWLVAVNYRTRREQANAAAQVKRNPYGQLAVLLHQLVAARDPAATACKRTKELDRWGARLVVMGSDQVLNAWNYFRRLLNKPFDDSTTGKVLIAVGLLLLAMRRDCGHRGTTLGPSEMIDPFLEDDEDADNEQEIDDEPEDKP